jgi:glycosyltransferase involved in cell wall biosynthesis
MNIVAFPYHDWRKGEVEGMRWRDGHLLETLGSHSAVQNLLVVDRPVSWAERLTRRVSPSVTGERIATKRLGMTVGHLTRVGPRTTVLDISVPDIIGPIRLKHAWWFSIFTRASVLELIDWAAGLTTGEHPNVIAWTPTVVPAIRNLKPSRVLFDSLDNWLLHPQLRRYSALASDAYASLLPTTDAVVVSAPRSRDVLRRWADNIEVIPNGVSPRQFEIDVERPLDMPSAPIVGYAGSLGARIDIPLVTEVARRLPGISFVFIGQALDRSTGRALAAIPNVHILGDRHYSKLPHYLRSFDVAWIPHTVGNGESGGDPIKMYEYWAAGLEVVSTPIDGLDQWADRLHLVRTAQEAVESISGLVDGSRPRKKATVPAERTWESITERLLALLSSEHER